MMDEDRGSSLKLLFQLRRTLCSKAMGSVALTTKVGPCSLPWEGAIDASC